MRARSDQGYVDVACLLPEGVLAAGTVAAERTRAERLESGGGEGGGEGFPCLEGKIKEPKPQTGPEAVALKCMGLPQALDH